MGIKLLILILILTAISVSLTTAEPVEDKQALLDFLGNTYHSQNLNWDERYSLCDRWIGVTCSSDESRIVALHLTSVGFRGGIPTGTLSRLSALQTLSLTFNAFSGSFPSDLFKLSNLSSLDFQFNNFHGPLPSDFSGWKNLLTLDLSSNSFTGNIPSSISNLTKLTSLNLSNNSFSGNLPDLYIPTLQTLNLTRNNLAGFLPPTLSRFPISSFSGNNINISMSMSNSPSPAETPRTNHSFNISQSAILGISIGVCSVFFVSIAIFSVIVLNRKKKREDAMSSASPKKENSTRSVASEYQGSNGRVTFFEGCNVVFDLEDLLRASAEVLGKGSFGTVYKAALEDATTVVVKRLKEVAVGRREFEQQMEVVGKVRHENVAPLRAYYYSKDEKLVVSDYYHSGSLSALLHAKRGENPTPLDWETRLKIAIGAARGIAHVHSRSGGRLVHGNIKSSNIFLNSHLYGCVSDLGLAPVMSPIPPPPARAAGYRAPEVADTRRAHQPSDVYSFGVVLLELLTGRSAVHAGGGEEAVHLVRWVHSVVREQWTGEVFDVELLREASIEEELVAVLQIGLSCVARVAEQRPTIGEVVRMVEEVRSFDGGSPGSNVTVTPSVREIRSPP